MRRTKKEDRYLAVSTWLRRERERKGWSLEKLANETTLSLSTVLRIEASQGQQPGFDAIGQILFALEVNPYDAAWVLMRLAGYPKRVCERAWDIE